MAREQQQQPSDKPNQSARGGQTAANQAGATDQENAPVRAEPQGITRPGPVTAARRLRREMDRLFDSFFGMDLFAPLAMPGMSIEASELGAWPRIDVGQEGDKLVIRADLPGMKREDVNVEVRDNAVQISGERRSETERNEGGYYYTERSYGNFHRTIPLPQGAKIESTSARFDNGVLKIEIEAPAKAGGRRIEVRDANAA